jgi:hypothetical protein
MPRVSTGLILGNDRFVRVVRLRIKRLFSFLQEHGYGSATTAVVTGSSVVVGRTSMAIGK